VKPYARYHQSISPQEEPDFYSTRVNEENPPRIFIDDFILASGLKYGLTVGYTFKNNLGVELSADYFNRHADYFYHDNIFSPPTSTFSHGYVWNYKTITFRPTLTFTVNRRKTSLTGKAGPLLALADAEQSDHWIVNGNDHKGSICTFDKNLNLGYNVGFEYNYHLSKSLAVAVELGLEQYNYTPEKSKVQYDDNKQVEIEYTNKITKVNLMTKQVRFKESILFNSLYFGIGIKYTIGGSK
jgi:hypothetical protein